MSAVSRFHKITSVQPTYQINTRASNIVVWVKNCTLNLLYPFYMRKRSSLSCFLPYILFNIFYIKQNNSWIMHCYDLVSLYQHTTDEFESPTHESNWLGGGGGCHIDIVYVVCVWHLGCFSQIWYRDWDDVFLTDKGT